MRFVAIILAALFLSLTLEPMADMVDWEEETHCCGHTASDCSTEEAPDLPVDQGENDCNSCNPFISCCGQMGFLIPDNLDINSLSNRVQLSDLSYRNTVSSQAVHSIWNPPKRGWIEFLKSLLIGSPDRIYFYLSFKIKDHEYSIHQ